MSTNTRERLDLAEFKFDIACHVHNHRTETDCPEPASWWALAQHHCRDRTVEAFWCQTHFDMVKNGSVARCRECRDIYHVVPRLIRTERIR